MQCYLAGRQAELLVYYYSVSLEAVLKTVIEREGGVQEDEGKRQQPACLHIPCSLS